MCASPSSTTASSTTVLAADVGGTNGRFQLWGPGDTLVAERVVPTAQFGTFGDALVEFLEGAGGAGAALGAACIAVAGPVERGRCAMTNCPWAVDASEVAGTLGLGVDRVAVINDFEAVGHGLSDLKAEDVDTVHAGGDDSGAGEGGAKVCLGPGTGLGVCVVTQPGDAVTAGEGGHAGFAPRGDLQRDLHAYVERELGVAEVESLVCGPGLERIHAFLVDREFGAAGGRGGWPTLWEAKEERARREKGLGDGPLSAEEVARRAEEGDGVAVRAVELLLALLGAEAGHMALRMKATGGVYVAGGVTPKLAKWWRGRARGDNPLLDAYLWPQQTQPFRALLQACPLHVILNQDVGLLGARAVARKAAAQ